MQIIKQEFSDRVEEINTFFRLLENITEKEARLVFPNDNNRVENFDFDVHSTLKSTSILLLYNLIEATISKCIERVHQIISSENITYDLASDSIQKIWLAQYYDRFKETSNNEKNALTNLKLMIDTLVRNNVSIELVFRDKEKRSSEISGNLDGKKIREIAEKYDIGFPNVTQNVLKGILDIKDKRIDLAHGVKSFLECGRDMTYPDLKTLKQQTIDFLQAFISAVENFITEKKYKR